MINCVACEKDMSQFCLTLYGKINKILYYCNDCELYHDGSNNPTYKFVGSYLVGWYRGLKKCMIFDKDSENILVDYLSINTSYHLTEETIRCMIAFQ